MTDFMVYVIASVITPGPNTIMSMRNGSRCGFVRGLKFNLGIYTGFTVLMLLCLLFSRTICRAVPQLQPVMAAAGCGYMLYQAWQCLRSKGLNDSRAKSGSYLEGLLLQFVNAKAFIFGITALSNFVLPVWISVSWQLLMCLLLSTTAFLCGLLWSAFGAVFSRLFVQHRKVTNTVMAGLLVYCAWKMVI